MVTGRLIFDNAMSLMDNRGDDTQEYKDRAVGIINQLAGELYPYSDTFTVSESGKRPVVGRIRSLSDTVNLDDYCCITVMPYGLAAHLLTTEDPNLASFLQQRYEELRALIARGFPQEFEEIEDAYSDSLTASGAWSDEMDISFDLSVDAVELNASFSGGADALSLPLNLDTGGAAATVDTDALVAAVFDAVYPVGSVYHSNEDIPPERGTWEVVDGRFVLAYADYAWTRTG